VKTHQIALLLLIALTTSCHRSQPTAKRFPFHGRIVSVDAQSQSALIDADAISGFMEAMAMSYKSKPASALTQLKPGDIVSAEVVVVQPDPKDEDAISDYWLENVTVTGHNQQPPGPSGTLHIPAAGEDVPDFAFTNQSGQKVSLHKYRDQTLLVTFIYTRCPFPDFCPRVSSNFNEIYKQLASTPALASVHLLSLSFDPAHDSPKVLRDYGFSVAHTRDPTLFHRWEFAAPSAADLPQIASFFALTVKPEGGLITHNLSTAVIAPNGKIAAWYHGSDWQVSDLIKDAAAAAGN
jgi:protein SCO1